jgi:hypothetical protein
VPTCFFSLAPSRRIDGAGMDWNGIDWARRPNLLRRGRTVDVLEELGM